MTEAELLRAVLQLAHKAGVLAHHCEDTRHCDGPSGFPDLILAGLEGILFRELKVQAHKHLSPGQVTWKWRLLAAGADWAIWTDADLQSGTIEKDIGRIA